MVHADHADAARGRELGVQPGRALIMKAGLGLIAAVAGLVSVGCGDDSLRTLSETDVVGIPPGDAIDALFFGQYALIRAWKGPCKCRVGACSLITIDTALGTATVVQADGTIQMTNAKSPTNICAGGIDGDGSLTCGSFVTAAGVMSYSLTTAHIALANGVPTTMSGAGENTSTLPGFDCDFQVSFEGVYAGP